MNDIIPSERIQARILTLRGQRVLLDADLAALYGVSTKRLNEQVRRNRRRFPGDFRFRLNSEERTEVVAKCDHLAKLRFSSALPYAFTEHGAIQAANVLQSEAAILMGVEVVRAFVRLRRLVVDQHALAEQFAALEARVGEHDEQLAAILAALRELTAPPEPPPARRIGFHPPNE